MKYFSLLCACSFLLACNKEDNNPANSELFQKLQSHMWKLDSTVFIDYDGTREVQVQATMTGWYVKFTNTRCEFYSSYNLNPPSYFDYDSVGYRLPNKIDGWQPAILVGAPLYTLRVDSVNDRHLVYSFFSSPEYIKTRECYYHAY